MTVNNKLYSVMFKRYQSINIKETAISKINPTWFYSVNPRLSKSQKSLTEKDLSNFREKSKNGEVSWTKFTGLDLKNLETKFQQFKESRYEKSATYYEKIENNFVTLLDPQKTSLKDFYSNVSDSSKPIYRIPIMNVGLINNGNNSSLFEVDLKQFTLSSIFWDGPVYKIRRSNWFNDDNMPLSSRMSEIIEEKFMELKPWTFSRNLNLKDLKTFEIYNLKKKKELDFFSFEIDSRIINILFIDEVHAYIIDDVKTLNSAKLFLLSNLPKGSSLLPGITHIRRGYDEKLSNVLNEVSKNKNQETSKQGREVPGIENDQHAIREEAAISTTDKIISDLSKLLAFNDDDDLLGDLKRNHNYETVNDKQLLKSPKKLKHVVFCVHGIGQILGSKYKNVNFINTVQQLRENLQVGCQEFLGEEHCNIEVIPIVWRNLIDFNNSPDTDKKLGELSDKEEKKRREDENNRFPSLKEVTVKEIMPLRYLINNTLLDILLYYENMYKNEILMQVVREINVAFRKFLIYYKYIHNEPFNGKVHLIGHSLGSAILYDILSLQYFNIEFISKENDSVEINKELNKKLYENSEFFQRYDNLDDIQLDFNVDKYFSIGSPFGLFNLLKNKKMKSRKGLPFYYHTDTLFDKINVEKTSYPLCNDIYNVFDTCDPVAYRIEPLVNAKFSDLTSKEMSYEYLHNKGVKSDDDDKAKRGVPNGTMSSIMKNANSTFNNADFGLKMINKQFENIINKAKDMFGDDDFNGKEVNDEASIKRIAKFAKELNMEKGVMRKISKHNKMRLDMLSKNKTQQENYNDCVLGGFFKKDDPNFQAKIDLLMCNSSGRLDYSIPKSVYDVLIVNTLRSHVTYFENDNIAKFLLNELLFNDLSYSARLIDDENKKNQMCK